MERQVKVDETVIKRVLAEVDVKWGDPGFDEVVEYLGLRYLHYQRIAVIKEMPDTVVDRAIPLALISDLGSYYISQFDATEVETVNAVKQMRSKYPFLKEVSAEQQQAAKKLIEALPLSHQAVLNLFYDGLSQADIVHAMTMKGYAVRIYATELKRIYLEVKERL